MKEAVATMEASLELEEDPQKKAMLYGNIGNCLRETKKYEKALEYHNMHLEAATELGDAKSQAMVLHNISNVEFELGNREKAMELRARSKKLME